ncbi:hypothetical protein VNO77_27215 [Canavalia gladiata]|uniref:Uncharacterized protein n=1 Tax=Canavalia gladiata TaxID=3824 RepID=A0AAN9KTQ8_CANGL
MTDLGITDQDRHTNFGITVSQELYIILYGHVLDSTAWAYAIDYFWYDDSLPDFVVEYESYSLLWCSLIGLQQRPVSPLNPIVFARLSLCHSDLNLECSPVCICILASRANTEYPSCLIHLSPNVTGLMDVKSRTLRDCVHTPIAEPDPIQQGFSACLWCFPSGSPD